MSSDKWNMNKEQQITVGIQIRCEVGGDPTFHTFLEMPGEARIFAGAHTTQREARYESQALMSQLQRCHFDVCPGCVFAPPPAPRISKHNTPIIGKL